MQVSRHLSELALPHHSLASGIHCFDYFDSSTAICLLYVVPRVRHLRQTQISLLSRACPYRSPDNRYIPVSFLSGPIYSQIPHNTQKRLDLLCRPPETTRVLSMIAYFDPPTLVFRPGMRCGFANLLFDLMLPLQNASRSAILTSRVEVAARQPGRSSTPTKRVVPRITAATSVSRYGSP